MRVPFSTISSDGDPYTVPLAGLFAEEDFLVRTGSLVATLRRVDDVRAEMQGRMSAVVVLPCDRCLADYDCMVESDVHLVFVVSSTLDRPLDEQEEELIVLTEPCIHLDDVLREQMWLILPVKRLCSEFCKGICARCGENLNKSDCQCAPTSGNPAFAVLEKLKKNKI